MPSSGTADGFPLTEYTPAGASAFLAKFAAWGLSLIVLGLLALLALLRYRSMIPLVLALLLPEQAAGALLDPLQAEALPGQLPARRVDR